MVHVVRDSPRQLASLTFAPVPAAMSASCTSDIYQRPQANSARGTHEGTLIVQETPQLPRPRRVLQLPQRLGLDLADALAGDRELLADLFQRVVGVHADAEAHAQHAFFARGQRGEHARGGLAQVRLDGGVDRQDRVLVLDEVAEVRILLVADRRFERERLLSAWASLKMLDRDWSLLSHFNY